MARDTPFKERLHIGNWWMRVFLSELFGTFMLVFITDGAVARTVLSRGAAGGALSLNIGASLAVTVCIYMTGGVSGGHINPAVTLSMCSLGRLRWLALPVYWFAQFIGAFLGAAVVYGIYLDGINSFEGGPSNRSLATAVIFATYPNGYPESFLSVPGGVMDQLVGSALLVGGIFAIFDKHNIKPPAGLEPIAVGLLLLVVNIAYGYNAGAAVNPARDFSPRLFTACAGYGKDIWVTPSGDHFWWIPLFVPLVGGPIGGWVYYLTIEVHHPHKISSRKAKGESLHLIRDAPAVEI
ncbi:aquaporin-9 [Strongylocentrotus purpuratus]|uniref:Aquaporin-3 n=1 Tax=Strongylocentrotus purpuratus TaxID=7668 RepID=A0A7M7RCX2_STRPU|nr:aquaporin-9 [Strongylocentrotus purpuratus]|eukprot:XP_789770.3 PREDICTED: aquaporin-9 [Strongylocentrotus purpuratus]